MSCLMGLVSCIWLVIDTNLSENANLLDPEVGPPSSENAQFYLLASLMGGSAAMVVILSLTSAADLIDDKTVHLLLLCFDYYYDLFFYIYTYWPSYLLFLI